MIEPFLTKFQGNYFKDHHSKYVSLIRLNFLALKRKQPPEVFYKKGIFNNLSKLRGKDLCQSPFFK